MGVSASACSCYTCILIIDHPNWAEGLWGEGEEVERRKARKIFISVSVLYSSHGMRRETTCNHISLALFCLMERNLLSASYMCVILHPYTGCIEPGVNWDMLLRQSLSEHCSELFWTNRPKHISHISDLPHMFHFQGILDIYGISLFTPDMACQD